MKQLLPRLCALTLALVLGCTLPNPNKAIAQMDEYWSYYKTENYDGLKRFYLFNNNHAQQHFKALFGAVHSLHTNYGAVKNVNLTGAKATTSTGEPDKIELTYEVEFDKKIINNQFTFKKDQQGTFKIDDHSFNP